MLLLVAILVLAIVGVVTLGSLQAEIEPQESATRLTALEETAYQGAALYAACSASTVSPGDYSASSFNIGLPATTPLGNRWGCVKAAGGAYGTYITVVTFLGVPTTVTGLDASNITTNPALQETLADQVVEDVMDRVQFAPNTIVGVIPAGSTALSVLAPASQSLTVLTAPLAYTSPAIVGNLFGTTPANNVLSTAP